MRHAVRHRQLRSFLINMAITWISQKFGTKLTSDFRIPRGKYKGESVRKHCIRAAKTKLVTEILDADPRPSFPLLIKSRTATEPSPHTNIEPSQVTCEAPAGGPVAKEVHCKATCEEGRPTNCEETPCDLLLKMSDSSQTSNEAPPTAEYGITEDGKRECVVHFYDSKENSMPLPAKRTLSIQTKYLGCPLELVIMCISFPSFVDVQEIKVWASNQELSVESSSLEPLEIPLLFATSPTDVKASFVHVEGLLEVCLPFVSYVGLFS